MTGGGESRILVNVNTRNPERIYGRIKSLIKHSVNTLINSLYVLVMSLLCTQTAFALRPLLSEIKNKIAFILYTEWPPTRAVYGLL